MLQARIIAACWIIFLIYWIANARAVKSAAEKQSFPSRAAHRLPVTIGLILLFLAKPQDPLMVVIPHTAASALIGIILTLLGLAAAIWARRVIADNWSSDVELKKEHALVERGPYHYVRHPIYSSLLLMSLGTAIARGNVGAFAGVLLIFLGFWIKLRQEERLMERNFPEQYPAYKTRVKALIPYVL